VYGNIGILAQAMAAVLFLCLFYFSITIICPESLYSGGEGN
jgi:hypothetical protein